MGKRRIVVLDIEEARADELVAALAKRDYLRVLKLDPDEREKLGICPACERKYPPPVVVKLSQALVEVVIRMAEKTQIAKSVIFVNNEKPLGDVSRHDHVRCVEADDKYVSWLELFGFAKTHRDGRHNAHFLTKKGLDLLAGNEVKPSRLTFAHGRVKADETATTIGQIKIADPIARDRLLTEAKEALAKIPPSVRKFIEGGQVSMMV